MITREHLLIIALALLLTVFFIGSIFFAGGTFGQRCAKAYKTQPEIEQCIERLVKNRGI